MSLKRDAKFHSMQAENNSSGSKQDSEFVDELQKLWDWSLENCSCLEIKARLRGIQVYTLKFSYCFGIHLAHLMLSHTDNLSQTLQSTQVTAVDAQVVSRACVLSNQFVLKMNSVYSGTK